MPGPYPASARARDRWVLERRGPKASVHASQPYATLWEEERDAGGALAPTAVVFVTNRECPFRCVMCDLWVHTLDARVPAGAVPAQIRAALARLPPARQVKLYNAGSFFDPQAIPPDDDAGIAAAVSAYERVIVEAHPAFLTGAAGDRCLRFRDRLRGRLEVAVGLETVHPQALERLNKRMTIAAFERAAAFLERHAIALRAFILLKPPPLDEDEGVEWACRSIDAAAAAGATACVVIPTRGGNGALEALEPAFVPPRIASLERVVEYGVSRRGPRVFGDLWGVEAADACGCGARRLARLMAMNREQVAPEPVVCACDRGR